METFQPTCLLGLAGQPTGLFTEELISTMTRNCEMLEQKPIIMVSHHAA
jgi:malic enzyme